MQGFCQSWRNGSADQAADCVRLAGAWKVYQWWLEPYLVYLTINAIFWVVMSSAAIIRSPSFSRSVESSTTINSPLPVVCIISQCTYFARCSDIQLNLTRTLEFQSKRAITVPNWVTHGKLQWCLLCCRSATSTPH